MATVLHALGGRFSYRSVTARGQASHERPRIFPSAVLACRLQNPLVIPAALALGGQVDCMRGRGTELGLTGNGNWQPQRPEASSTAPGHVACRIQSACPTCSSHVQVHLDRPTHHPHDRRPHGQRISITLHGRAMIVPTTTNDAACVWLC